MRTATGAATGAATGTATGAATGAATGVVSGGGASAGHGTRSRAARAPVRLTRRGRVCLWLLVVSALVAALSAGFWAGTLRSSSAATVGGDYRHDVVVSPGDTLWEPARRNVPDSDPRLVVYRIMRINGLDDAEVWPGQRLAVPDARHR